jgi:MFS family permease
LVASAYFSIYALIALTSGAWIRRVNWRITVRVGFVAMIAGLSVCLASESFAPTVVGLSVVGAGAGLLFPISLTLVSDMRHADRTYAIKLSAEQLTPAGLLLLLSGAALNGAELQTILFALALVIALCFVLSAGLPVAGDLQKHTTGPSSGGGLAILSLVALAVNFAGFAGLWAFLERLASAQAFEAGFTARWIAVGLITSGLGPLGAAALEDRLGRRVPLGVATLVAILSLVLLTNSMTRLHYALVLAVLPLSYYFAIAYIFGVVADADHNGRMSGLMSFALAIGAASGPALFGLIRTCNGPVILAMALFIAVGAAIILWIQTNLLKAERRVAS